uniref:Uncharacterized protein n=1 Tax=Oryza glaberrima TaxID=4538 RepID=I1QHJ5_ORYGL
MHSAREHHAPPASPPSSRRKTGTPPPLPLCSTEGEKEETGRRRRKEKEREEDKRLTGLEDSSDTLDNISQSQDIEQDLGQEEDPYDYYYDDPDSLENP